MHQGPRQGFTQQCNLQIDSKNSVTNSIDTPVLPLWVIDGAIKMTHMVK